MPPLVVGKTKTAAKTAPMAKKLKVAPIAAGNKTVIRREEPGRKVKSPPASASYAAAVAGCPDRASGTSVTPTNKLPLERAASGDRSPKVDAGTASVEAAKAARKLPSNGFRTKAAATTSLPAPMV